THELIRNQSHLKFALVALLPRDDLEPELKYELPENVVSFTTINLQKLEPGKLLSARERTRLFEQVRETLHVLTTGKATLKDFTQLIDTFQPYLNSLGHAALLDSEES